jgi:hypothetical protein
MAGVYPFRVVRDSVVFGAHVGRYEILFRSHRVSCSGCFVNFGVLKPELCIRHENLEASSSRMIDTVLFYHRTIYSLLDPVLSSSPST